MQWLPNQTSECDNNEQEDSGNLNKHTQYKVLNEPSLPLET